MTAQVSFIDAHVLDYLDDQDELHAEFAKIFAEEDAREKGLPPKPKWPPLNPDDDEIPFDEGRTL